MFCRYGNIECLAKVKNSVFGICACVACESKERGGKKRGEFLRK